MADRALEALATPRPTGRTRTLRRLTSWLDTVVADEDDPQTVAARAGMLLRPALEDPALLEARHCEPATDRYRAHLVHVHPAGRYSVVALVWRPGQATPIHDHRCWCVVGVWRGLERETTYDLHEDRDSQYLVPRRAALTAPGDVSVLVPPDEDIHRVENGGSSIAISVHVYGDDLGALGSSINREFADTLVRERPVSDGTAALSWRSLDEAALLRRAAAELDDR
jgi:predicted metal-dependent enzyme (double-stranded beta helix superfamily)